MSTSRRDFLKTGGALVVGFTLVPRLAGAQPARLPGSLNGNRRLDAWIAIEPNGRVTIFTGKIELGQGIGTALSQIAADELDVELARIDVVHGDTACTPNEGQTAGSLSVEQSGTAVRFACAEARHILLSAAASKLGAPATELKVSDGTVAAPGGASVTYWDLASAADFKREASAKVTPKPASARKWVGKSVGRRDIPKKFTGGAAYVQDLRLPRMLFGRVVRPPSPGATLTAVDEGAVKRLPGVVAVVRDGNFLAVAAEREEQAIRARETLKRTAKWTETASLEPSGDALFRHLMSATAPAHTVVDKTSPIAATPAKTLEAVYTRPYQCHASLGPSCAVAQWQEGALTVWTHSQGVFPLRADLAKAFAIDAKRIRCIHAEGAGCYGHNGADDVALDAALLARAVDGRPVKVQWMRDDEFQWEPYGSAMVMKLAGGVDAQGHVVAWSHEVWSHPHSTRPGSSSGVSLLAARHLAGASPPPPPNDVPQPAGGSDRNAVPLYEFSSVKVVKHFIVDAPLRTSALRTLGGYANVFAAESFVDELAAAAGVDPVEFRLRHLKDPRARAVVEAAARRAGWQPRGGGGPRLRGPHAQGSGFAYSRYKNLACYCATAAEVEVERATGRVRVTRVVAAVDAGQIVNPDGVVNQIEGGVIQSASWTLKEAVGFDRTRVTTRSWADYPILRFDEVPDVEVVLLDQPNERFLGVGEGSQGPAVAAIANAIAHATGTRLRALPFTPERVKQALSAKG
ncbi:MAG: xanthine dehydrogenase family protein molybdopterin-binding subunit [Candidatus Rokubacteria bacterium]|nr:xanthine dehydrogenase family protein molybdopterin-binding subunit [Candidatus Rokubacteria bacterium]